MYNVGAGDDNSYSESLESKYTVADILSSMANTGAGGEPPISVSTCFNQTIQSHAINVREHRPVLL